MKAPIVLAVLALLLLAAVGLSPLVGDQRVKPDVVVRAIFWPSDPDLKPQDLVIVRELRLPRILLAALVGAGLAAAGAGYQGLFRNALADPFVIGASSGAALGATIAIIGGSALGGEAALVPEGWQLGSISLFAMAGALLAVGLVYAIATVGGQAPVTSLLLAGVAISSCLTAVVSLLMFLNKQDLIHIVSWLMGSIASTSWPQVVSTFPLVVLGISILLFASRGLDALSFGDESASALGLRLNVLRGTVVVAASIATAAAVAVAGVVGFVGLMAPHFARFFVGPKHVVLIPASCLVGALLMVLADDVARTILSPRELPVGIVTALLGGPFFLYLLKSRQSMLGQG